MKLYSHILLALELSPETDKQIIEKTKELSSQFQAQISLIHSIEQLTNFGAVYSMAGGIDLERALLEEAKKTISKIGESLHIPEPRQIITLGLAKQRILNSAKEIGADLIVMGSHGRQGMRLLLGSTTNAVLHGATCDVLAVRVK